MAERTASVFAGFFNLSVRLVAPISGGPGPIRCSNEPAAGPYPEPD